MIAKVNADATSRIDSTAGSPIAGQLKSDVPPEGTWHVSQQTKGAEAFTWEEQFSSCGHTALN